MSDEDLNQHSEVMSSLLDLQRRLRGVPADEPVELGRPSVRTAEHPVAPPMPAESVEVSEPGVGVRMTPAPRSDTERHASQHASEPPPPTTVPTTAGADRVAALAQRLRHLEEDLSGVLGSIQSMTGDVSQSVSADVTARMGEMQREVDSRTSRIVSERLSAVSDRLARELEAQRRDLTSLLERRIGGMEATLRSAIRDASEAGPGDDPEQ